MNIMRLLFSLIISGALLACGHSTPSGISTTVVGENPFENIDSYKMDVTRQTYQDKVCNPIQLDAPAITSDLRGGLVGRLKYLKKGQTPFSNVEDYIKNGTEAPAEIYLDSLFIPTRAFTEGFPI